MGSESDDQAHKIPRIIIDIKTSVGIISCATIALNFMTRIYMNNNKNSTMHRIIFLHDVKKNSSQISCFLLHPCNKITFNTESLN